MAVVVKGLQINEKGQLSGIEQSWILPDNLNAEVGDLALVETKDGQQIVSVTNIVEWDNKKIERVQEQLANLYNDENHKMRNVIAVQPGAKK